VLPALLALVAAVADSTGAHGLGFYMLVGALPFTAVAALASFGDYLETREDAVSALQSLLWAVALVLLVLACAVRSQSLEVPPLAASSLVACLGVFAIKAVVAAAPLALRLALRPAKP
jgi:hypothetical protein